MASRIIRLPAAFQLHDRHLVEREEEHVLEAVLVDEGLRHLVFEGQHDDAVHGRPQAQGDESGLAGSQGAVLLAEGDDLDVLLEGSVRIVDEVRKSLSLSITLEYISLNRSSSSRAKRR